MSDSTSSHYNTATTKTTQGAILVIDDNFAIREALTGILTFLPEMSVYTAADGQERLQIFQQQQQHIALILGLFTSIAAFLGGLWNWNFIMAGSASTNGMLFFVSVLLILAWKVAGYIGLDYFPLPLLGTPWRRETAEPIPVPTKVRKGKYRSESGFYSI